jgi:hypothetical protein
MLTLGFTENRQKVSYFSRTDLTTLIKDHTTGYGVSLSGTWLHNNRMFSGGISYERSYKSADSVQVCSTVTGSTSLTCPQGSIGAPKRTIARILFAESRVLIIQQKFAASPRVEYDVATSKLGVRVPLYFAPNKANALIAGIALGYANHGDGFNASVFVGKAFSFF